MKQEQEQKLKGYNKQSVNYFYHRKGWTIFQGANKLDHHKTSVVYEALLSLWNDRGFPNYVWFTKLGLEGLNSNIIMSDGQYAAVFKELQGKGLISFYQPGSKSGKLHYSMVKMVNLSDYYLQNREPKQDAEERFAQAPKPAPVPTPAPVNESLAELLKAAVPGVPPVAPPVPPSVLQVGESDIVDVAQKMAEKAMELYKVVHKVDAAHGLSAEAEIYTSIQLSSYIAAKEVAKNAEELSNLIKDKLGEKIDEDGLLFISSMVEKMFLKHASGKHGTNDFSALRSAFRQKPETQAKAYISMVGAAMQESGLSYWCDVYHILSNINNVLHRAASDTSLSANEMNPYFIATYKWGKYSKDRANEKKGKKMQGNKSKNMRKSFEQD